MEQVVILFCGKAGVGKSTSARFAMEYAHQKKFYNSEVFNFAYAVKQCAKQFFEWDGNKDTWGRKLLQEIGKFGRNVNENLWVNHLIERVNDSYSYLAFIDDCRFPNEVKRMHEYFRTYVVRIESPEREILKGTPAYDDPSETSLPEGIDSMYDFIIWNTGSLKDLQETIQGIVDIILEKENE